MCRTARRSFGAYTKGKTSRRSTITRSTSRRATPYPLMVNDLVDHRHRLEEARHRRNDRGLQLGQGRDRHRAVQVRRVCAGRRIVIDAQRGLLGQARPKWDKVTLKPIKSGPSRVAALLAGDVDVIEEVPTTDIARLKKDKRVSLSSGISNRVIYLHLDHARDDSPYVKANDGGAIKNPLKDLRVRQAISKAINRPAIVARVMEGLAIPAGQLLPKAFFGVSQESEAGEVRS